MIGSAANTAIPDNRNDQRRVRNSERIAEFCIKCYKVNCGFKMGMKLTI